MPIHVNLDALIRREDFETKTDMGGQPSSLTDTARISDLARDSIFYAVLRKPDFQRETANWTPEKIAGLVESFLNGDLIPSIILWKSPTSGNVFVIDGAHRLSALIAWVHDDYGDKYTSMPFFGENIPHDQKKAAEQARSLIQKRVGSYEDLSAALRDPDSVPKEKVHYAPRHEHDRRAASVGPRRGQKGRRLLLSH